MFAFPSFASICSTNNKLAFQSDRSKQSQLLVRRLIHAYDFKRLFNGSPQRLNHNAFWEQRFSFYYDWFKKWEIYYISLSLSISLITYACAHWKPIQWFGSNNDDDDQRLSNNSDLDLAWRPISPLWSSSTTCFACEAKRKQKNWTLVRNRPTIKCY